MSKGTKQIRFGKVQKVIDEIDLHIKVLQRSRELLPETSEDGYYYDGRIDALETIKKDLQALGE